jgi:hypothetical protein
MRPPNPNFSMSAGEGGCCTVLCLFGLVTVSITICSALGTFLTIFYLGAGLAGGALELMGYPPPGVPFDTDFYFFVTSSSPPSSSIILFCKTAILLSLCMIFDLSVYLAISSSLSFYSNI